ncbi:MAG: CocE/NonD family hydrolase [Dehalococcoidia bacterium]
MAQQTAAPGSTRQGSHHQYNWLREDDVLVPMRDGVRLAADIYRPALDGRPAPGPFPALLERTPYNKRRLDLTAAAKFFARHGYVVALQDVRGRFASEGEWYAFGDEGPDGEDTVRWLHTLDGCDGRVGTIGLSYSASDQTALACLNPPGLAAMFVAEGMSNYHTSAMRQGGAAELRFLVYAFYMATTSKEALANRPLYFMLQRERRNVREWLTRLPLRPDTSPLRHLPSYERWITDVITHGDYDDYWKRPGYTAEEYWEQHADVPVYLLGGWYDSYCRSTTDMYVELTQRKHSPVRLIMGPWVHGVGTMAQSWSGDVDFGQDAPMDDYNGFRLRWFDQHLKGLDTSIDDEPPVRIFVMGGGSGRRNTDGRMEHGGRWRDEQEWPLARTSYTPYYLHEDGTLSPAAPAHAATPTTYAYDPLDPVPTIGGNISVGFEIMPNGAFDQRGSSAAFGAKDSLPLAARSDVLVFQTPPLEQDVEVTGPIEVELWASSSCPDTDFTAKLLDVHPPNPDEPDGYAMNLADSIIRARYRNDRTRAEFLTPGEIVELTITLYPTSNLFTRGHRIRLDVSSSNFPRFDVNPNTGDPLGRHRRTVVAHNSIYHDPAHPSHIILPVIPLDAS